MATLRVTALAVPAAVALSLLASPAAAQTDSSRNHLYSKFQFAVSGTSVLLGTDLRVDGNAGDGTDLDVEEDLGLDRSKFQPRFAFRWRPGRRHELELGYQFARRTGEKTLSEDISFGDTTFRAGLTVKPTFNSDQAFLVYRFAFMAKERTQIGAALGLGPYFFDVAIDALASVSSGSQSREVAFSESASVVGPTASVGLFGRFRLGDRWYLDADVRAIAISIDRFKATVIDAGLAARYFMSRKIGLELGYGGNGVKVEIKAKDGVAEAGLESGRIKFGQQIFRFGIILAP
jgi:hypothetical protein